MKELAVARTENAPACSLDDATCPPSHIAARRISTTIIGLLSTAIVALTMWNHFVH